MKGSILGRRTAAVLASAAALAVALAGCSASRSGSDSAANSSSCDLTAYTKAHIDWKQQAGKTITLAVEEHPWWEAVKPQLACFEKLTGITVKPSVLGEEQFVSKLPTTLSSGSSTPDVFMVNQYGQAQGSGWLEPLNSYLDNKKLTDASWYNVNDFFQGVRDFSQTDGQYLVMPITAESQMLFIRDDLVKTPPTTMDQLEQAAAAANKDGVAGFGSRGVANLAETPWTFGGFAFSEGGTFLNSSGAPELDSAANVSALKIYTDLIRNYGPKGESGWGYLQNEQAMQQGKLAIWTDSSTFLGALKNPKLSTNAKDINAYPFPAGSSGKSHPSAWIWTVGINSKSQAKDASWLFLQWATSEPMSEKGALTGASPARQAAWDSADASAAIGEDNAQRIKEAIANTDSSYLSNAWKNPAWSQVADPLARAINAAVSGAPAEQQLQDAQKSAEAVLKK